MDTVPKINWRILNVGVTGPNDVTLTRSVYEVWFTEGNAVKGSAFGSTLESALEKLLDRRYGVSGK